MKRTLIAFVLVLLSHNSIALAETLTPDQTEIKSLVQKMYAIEPERFEFTPLGAKYKNCAKLDCMAGVGGFFRYPRFDSMDNGAVTRTAPPMPI